jgi:transposase
VTPATSAGINRAMAAIPDLRASLHERTPAPGLQGNGRSGRSKALAVAGAVPHAGVMRYPMPPYTHELNPVEQVWSHLKRSLASLAKRNTIPWSVR